MYETDGNRAHPPLFKLEQVRYRSVLTLDNLLIEAGKITCLTGASGGGKTTLLKLLAKLVSPDAGRIYYQGEDLATRDSIIHRRSVVLLSQQPYIFPGSIGDNLQLGLRIVGKTMSDAALLETLKQVRLKQPLEAAAENLSGGEAQRLALARVLVLDAPVILLDEPSSALDDDTERHIIETVVAHVRSTHKTLIMVTHAHAKALPVADCFFAIEAGRLAGGGCRD